MTIGARSPGGVSSKYKKILAAWVVSVLGIPKCGELDSGPVKAEIVISATEIVFSVLLQLGWSEA